MTLNTGEPGPLTAEDRVQAGRSASASSDAILSGPYAHAATLYYDAGWLGVLPLDDNGNPPTGFTGYEGAWPTREQVAEWLVTRGNSNIGLRVPDDVIGIDVDAYDGKNGAKTILVHEINLGPLPQTWRSTSRMPEDTVSGIYWFRVPPGKNWHDLGGNVEVIRRGHRFGRVWPGIAHRTGRRYEWFTPEGTLADRVPSPSELPSLPAEWVPLLEETHRSSDGRSIGRNDSEPLDLGEIFTGLNEGERDNKLYKYACSLRSRHPKMTAEEAYVLVERFGAACDPPFPEEWCRRKVDQAWKHAPGITDDIAPSSLAWAHAVLSGRPQEPVSDEAVSPDESPEIPPSLMVTSYQRQKADRIIKRRLDDEEIAAARGPRVRRTAREFAEVPKPAVVMSEVLAAEVNLLGGPSEAGKSLLARDWMLHVASGVPWRGHEVRERRTGLWVPSEGTHDFEDRWKSQSLWERAADNIYVLEEPINLLSPGDVNWLLEEYDDVRPGYIVFDVIYGMGLPDDNGTKDVVPLITSMKRVSAAWGAATLALGHPGHNGDRRFRGSSSWRQLAAVEWHLADGELTCEKSKIANKSTLTLHYEVGYPDIRWLSTGDQLVDEAARYQLIEQDFINFPDSSDAQRARRLQVHLGLGDRATRTRIKTHREGRRLMQQ